MMNDYIPSIILWTIKIVEMKKKKIVTISQIGGCYEKQLSVVTTRK